jgi:hypothetical protein
MSDTTNQTYLTTSQLAQNDQRTNKLAQNNQ